MALQGRGAPRGPRNWASLSTSSAAIPSPGPGLAVRILGDITREKVRILQDADDIFIQGLRDWKVKDDEGHETSLYDHVWQAGVIPPACPGVWGVMGDEAHLRACRGPACRDLHRCHDGRLGPPCPMISWPRVSNDIINKVKGVNRVAYGHFVPSRLRPSSGNNSTSSDV